MFQRSVIQLFKVSGWACTLVVITGAMAIAVNAWSQLGQTDQTVRLAVIDRDLFMSMSEVRQSTGTVKTTFIEADDALPRLNAIHGEMLERTLKSETLIKDAAVDTATLLLPKLQTLQETEAALWRDLETMARQTKELRDVKKTTPWFDAVQTQVTTLSEASYEVGHVLSRTDSFTAQMVATRQTAYSMRDQAGLLCATLRPNVQSSQPLDTKTSSAIYSQRAIADEMRKQLLRLSRSNALPQTVAEAIKSASTALVQNSL